VLEDHCRITGETKRNFFLADGIIGFDGHTEVTVDVAFDVLRNG
jgi:hypothetical protein